MAQTDGDRGPAVLGGAVLVRASPMILLLALACAAPDLRISLPTDPSARQLALEQARLDVARASAEGRADVEVRGGEGEQAEEVLRLLEAWGAGDPASDPSWRTHPNSELFLSVQPMVSAAPDAWLALWRRYSDFDHENGIRPYIFRLVKGRVVDHWRGTALSRPLVAARLFTTAAGERLCAILRDDSFLALRPGTLGRIRAVYRWAGTTFRTVHEPEATARCDQM